MASWAKNVCIVFITFSLFFRTCNADLRVLAMVWHVEIAQPVCPAHLVAYNKALTSCSCVGGRHMENWDQKGHSVKRNSDSQEQKIHSYDIVKVTTHWLCQASEFDVNTYIHDYAFIQMQVTQEMSVPPFLPVTEASVTACKFVVLTPRLNSLDYTLGRLEQVSKEECLTMYRSSGVGRPDQANPLSNAIQYDGIMCSKLVSKDIQDLKYVKGTTLYCDGKFGGLGSSVFGDVFIWNFSGNQDNQAFIKQTTQGDERDYEEDSAAKVSAIWLFMSTTVIISLV